LKTRAECSMGREICVHTMSSVRCVQVNARPILI